MGLSASLSRLVTLTCLTLFLSASLVSPAHAGSGKSKGWGKGGKNAQSNSVPSISGVPAASVGEGSTYVFRPSASDADGDSLTFSIQNRPSWASFSSSSGRLSGTPTADHIGTYGNITITVSDGSSSASLSPFSITVLDNGNEAPTISGSPATSVDEDAFYNFQPVAGDVDGDDLAFSIENRPAWAKFNSSTGRLAGTPGAGDAGSYSNIRISVSDGTASTSLPAFSITVNSPTALSGSVSLSWVAPTSRSDGTPISVSELSGYTVHYGSEPGSYTNSVGIDDPFATSLTVTDLPVGTYYFVLTAEDSNGLESDYSGVVTKQVQ
jgi:hypothetical protein